MMHKQNEEATSVKYGSRAVALIVVLCSLISGCTSKPAPPAPSAPQAPKMAWQPVLGSGSADLFYAAPDGSGYLFLETQGGSLVHVSATDSAPRTIPVDRRTFQVGDVTVEAPLAETPYGRMLVAERPNARLSLSPDGRRLAIAEQGLWVADLEGGAVTRVSSEPQPPPVPLVKHQTWVWANYPSWSADGKWIDFYATREQPNQSAHWRVPAQGGKEELVSRQDAGPYGSATLPDGRVVRTEDAGIGVYPAGGGKPVTYGADLSGPVSISPDGRWALILDRARPALVIVDVMAGKTREIPLPPGSGPEMDPRWRGDQVLFRTRPMRFDGPAFLTIVDMPTGRLTQYTTPEPAGADVWPLGWDGQGRVLARILPLPTPGGVTPPTAPQGAWLLDPAAYLPPAPATPGKLLYAGLAGPGQDWKQFAGDGPVTGGEVGTVPQAILWLRLDQPLDESWIRQSVKVEGPGTLEVHGAPLGLAFVRLAAAKPGDTVRVQIPAFQFDLRLKF